MPFITNSFGDPIANVDTRYDNVVPKTNPVEARKNDLQRITKWLNSPAGAQFAAKQALLRTTGNLESFSARDIATAAGRGVTDAASAVASILAQVPVNGTGTHFLFNELSSLVFQNSSFYAGNRFAANQANYRGTVTIKKSNKVVGGKTLNDRGFGKAGNGDYINSYGYVTDQEEANTLLAEDLDLVPFYFKVLKNPSEGVAPFDLISFRAFLTDISDNVTGNWNSLNFVGRGEPFYVYTGHDRNISFNLKVAAFSKEELVPLYEKINALQGTTAPEYTGAGYMKGVITKLTIGNYVNNIVGHIEGVNISVSTDYPWETEDRTIVIPTVLDISVNFKPTPSLAPQAPVGGIVSNFVNQP